MKEYSISELQEKMAAGKITAQKIVKEYLVRIDEIDKNGPKLNAIIEINPDALKIADKLDQERKNGKTRGSLHGIPVVLKDNIGTADRMRTTAGSLALEGNIAPEDAFIVRNLRKAGAIILGKTNLSEWANFRSNRSTSGWCSRGGQTRNPYVLDRNPCGSSSGSAVAVAANLCSVAVGTETNGSIICPSHVNSVVGIKPTVGLISRTGIIPISHTQDTAGPMARTVRDAVLLLNVLVGSDPEEPSTINSEKELPNDYTDFLDPNGLEGGRIGVARNFFGRNNHVDQIMEQAIEKMKELGATIIDPTNITTLEELRDPELQLLLFDFKNDLNDYLEKFGENITPKCLKEIIDFNEQNKEEVMPFFGQELFLMAEEKGPLSSEEYKEVLEKCLRLSRDEGIDKVMEEHELDVIIAPSGGPAWPTDLINGDHFTGGSSSPAAIAGYPNITVPVGYVFGLPVGISFFSGAFQEPTLIKFTYAFEQATKVRQPPKFIPTIKFD
ncbi:MAG: amidase [Candidatus Heimdallarchaeota archaeon]|nr:amidase [Candidatus Heimdallarchaeota archaeon]